MTDLTTLVPIYCKPWRTIVFVPPKTKESLLAKPGTPQVTCYLCRRTFQKEVGGAAHNRNYYRCEECLR